MVEIELVGSSESLTLTNDEILSISPAKVHTGLADMIGRVLFNRNLEDFASRQDRMNIKQDGVTQWTGYITDVEHRQNRNTKQTQIEGVGIAKKLEETRPDYDNLSNGELTYTNIALQDALRDYWPRTPFDTHTVIDQQIESVATDSLAQEANTNTKWQNVTSLSDSDPWNIANGNLEQAQTAYFLEGENGTGASGTPDGLSGEQKDSYSSGDAAPFDSTGETADYTFSLGHDIPAGEVGVAIRADDGGGGTSAVDFLLDGTQIDTIATGTGLLLDWDDLSDGAYNGSGVSGGLTAGSHTITIDCTDGGGSTEIYYADCVVLFDRRYTDPSNWDNTVNTTGGYLDDPPLFPLQESIELDTVNTAYNVPEADVTSTWNSTADNAIAISNDNGTAYQSESNVSTTTQTFTGAGRQVRVKFTADAFGSRDTATPRLNFNGQTITDYQLLVDGDNLVVIDDLTLSRNHFDNLQKLHSYGDFIWAIDHDSGSVANMQVTSFRRGEQSRPPPSKDHLLENDPEIKAKQYYNQIYLQGALVNGTRPTAEVEDTTEINDVGKAISPGVLRDPSVVTEAGAVFRARSLLEKAVRNNELRGRKTYAAQELETPGFNREFDFGEGAKEYTVEKVEYTKSNSSLRVSFDTVQRDELSREIQELKRNVRDQGDKV